MNTLFLWSLSILLFLSCGEEITYSGENLAFFKTQPSLIINSSLGSDVHWGFVKEEHVIIDYKSTYSDMIYIWGLHLQSMNQIGSLYRRSFNLTTQIFGNDTVFPVNRTFTSMNLKACNGNLLLSFVEQTSVISYALIVLLFPLGSSLYTERMVTNSQYAISVGNMSCNAYNDLAYIAWIQINATSNPFSSSDPTLFSSLSINAILLINSTLIWQNSLYLGSFMTLNHYDIKLKSFEDAVWVVWKENFFGGVVVAQVDFSQHFKTLTIDVRDPNHYNTSYALQNSAGFLLFNSSTFLFVSYQHIR